MKKEEYLFKRLEKNPAGKPIQSILKGVLKNIDRACDKNTHKIPFVWESLLDAKFVGMTEVIKFQEGTLYIRVKSATLYSILSLQEKESLLKKLKAMLPKIEIKTIVFRR